MHWRLGEIAEQTKFNRSGGLQIHVARCVYHVFYRELSSQNVCVFPD